MIAFLLSADPENDSDVLALTGASAALSISSIPFLNPIAAVRVGLVEDEIVINPTFSERKASDLDLIIAGSSDAVMMVEAGAKEVPEDTMLKALEEGHAAIREIVAEIEKMASELGASEWEADKKQFLLAQQLFSLGDRLSAADLLLLNELIKKLGGVADQAEKIGKTLRIFLSR